MLYDSFFSQPELSVVFNCEYMIKSRAPGHHLQNEAKNQAIAGAGPVITGRPFNINAYNNLKSIKLLKGFYKNCITKIVWSILVFYHRKCRWLKYSEQLSRAIIDPVDF